MSKFWIKQIIGIVYVAAIAVGVAYDVDKFRDTAKEVKEKSQ